MNQYGGICFCSLCTQALIEKICYEPIEELSVSYEWDDTWEYINKL